MNTKIIKIIDKIKSEPYNDKLIQKFISLSNKITLPYFLKVKSIYYLESSDYQDLFADVISSTLDNIRKLKYIRLGEDCAYSTYLISILKNQMRVKLKNKGKVLKTTELLNTHDYHPEEYKYSFNGFNLDNLDLNKLTENSKNILSYILEGYDIEETAKLENITVSAIKKRRIKLFNEIKKQYNENKTNK